MSDPHDEQFQYHQTDLDLSPSNQLADGYARRSRPELRFQLVGNSHALHEFGDIGTARSAGIAAGKPMASAPRGRFGRQRGSA